MIAKGAFQGAERSGFEPEKPVSRLTGLAIRRFRPLSHLSGSWIVQQVRAPKREPEPASIVKDYNPAQGKASPSQHILFTGIFPEKELYRTDDAFHLPASSEVDVDGIGPSW